MNTHNVDEKRGRRQMLLIYVAIGIIAAVITGWFVYQNRMEYWETQARSAFRVALGKDPVDFDDIRPLSVVKTGDQLQNAGDARL